MKRDHRYDDILDLDRPPSPGHPPMPAAHRAAQFAPFAALTGYEDAIEEAARWVDAPVGNSEEGDRRLDAQLRALMARLPEKPRVRVTYFVRDPVKDGGRYVTREGRLRRLNEGERYLMLEDRTVLRFSDILEIACPGEPEENENT